MELRVSEKSFLPISLHGSRFQRNFSLSKNEKWLQKILYDVRYL